MNINWELIFNKEILFKAIASIIVLFLSFIIIKILKITIRKFFGRFKTTSSPKKLDTLQSVLLSTVKYTIYFMGLCIILSIFNVQMGTIITTAGMLSISVGFAAQTFIKDVISGLSILITNAFGVGDIITVGTCTGKVETFGIQSTKIRAVNGDLHIIPNSEIKIITKINITDENRNLYNFPYYKSED